MSKFCFKCKLAIEKDQRRVKIEDIECEGGKTFSKLLFHKQCWHEHQTMKKEQRDVFGLAKSFIIGAKNKIGIDNEEVIEI